MILKMADGSRRKPKDSDEVRCDAHNFVTTWGAIPNPLTARSRFLCVTVVTCPACDRTGEWQ